MGPHVTPNDLRVGHGVKFVEAEFGGPDVPETERPIGTRTEKLNALPANRILVQRPVFSELRAKAHVSGQVAWVISICGVTDYLDMGWEPTDGGHDLVM